MKILVTGANGFIGSNLVKRLIADGKEVIGLVRKSSDLSFLNGINVKLIYGDITDKNSLKDAFNGVNLVYHIAGLAADWGKYEKFENINYQGTINVAEAAAQNGVNKFVYLSTVAFHGFGKVNMGENSPVADNLNAYSKTKYLAENWLFNFAKTSNMKVTAIRPGNVFGEYDRTFMAKYLKAMQDGKFSEINKGASKTCPVYIGNLIDILTLVANNDSANGEAFIATDGLDIDWHTFNSKLAKALNIKLPKLSVPYSLVYAIAKIYYGTHKMLGIKSEPFLTPYRINNGGKDYHFSIAKLNKYFSYKPKVGIDEAIERTVNWYLN